MQMISKKILIPLSWKLWRHQEVRRRLSQPNGEVQELDVYLTMKVFEDTPAILSSESFPMNMDTQMRGSTVKNHISLERCSDTM